VIALARSGDGSHFRIPGGIRNDFAFRKLFPLNFGQHRKVLRHSREPTENRNRNGGPAAKIFLILAGRTAKTKPK
jgi:hypothetical protein